METLGIWVLAIVLAFVGVGIMLELDQLTNTLRLMDVACFES
jgi:hypothetical protein